MKILRTINCLPLFLLMMLVCCQLNSRAQFTKSTSFPVKGELVKVDNWGSRALYIISDSYFSETRDSIIAQIGEKEFDEMEATCSVPHWPTGLYGSDLTEEEDKAFDKKLDQLKMYKIAAYTHIFNGKRFDRYVILRVPYNENGSWNKAVQWEGNIYFMLKEKDVTVVGK